MVEAAIGLGLVISLIFAESLGLAAGGWWSRLYRALHPKPLLVIGTILRRSFDLGTPEGTDQLHFDLRTAAYRFLGASGVCVWLDRQTSLYHSLSHLHSLN